MSQINGKITMSTCEGRPCWVKGRRAIFHRWSDSARPVKPASNDQDTDERMQKWSVHGIVEYEDGTVEREWPSAIQFADSREYFDSLAWEEMEARRDAMDRGENLGNVDNPACESCGHYSPLKDGCIVSINNCERCVADCICRTCTDSDKWEPKGGKV